MITATTFSGNLTGTAGTFSSLSVSGNVSIGGTLTYDDVVNVDSIGVITARSGIILGPTSNDLRLGTGATISSPASNRLSFLTSGEEQVRINDVGRVGIGSLSPGTYWTFWMQSNQWSRLRQLIKVSGHK